MQNSFFEMDRDLLLSFIIPIYQVEDYVGDCLHSICKQDVKCRGWFEIICINDGTKDRSIDVVRRIAREYPNIKIQIIDKDNEGVSVARNTGIISAKGKYLWFVDSDDIILQDSLQLLYEYISADDGYDLISALYYQTYEVDSTMQIYKGQNKNHKAFYASCIRRQFLVDNDIFFAPGVAYGEDLLFYEMVQFLAKKKLELPYVLYAYRQRNESAMNRQDGGKKYIDSLEKRLYIYTELDLKYKRILNNKDKRYFINLRDGVVRNILLYHLRAQDKDTNMLLNELKADGCYPYRFRINDLFVFYSWPDFIIKVFCFLFPIPLYYKLVSKGFSLFKDK